MRWEDEHWIKLYTRDTLDWDALGWEAQALWFFVFRKLDASGVLDLGKKGAKGLAAALGMPFDVFVRALSTLLEDGCLVLNGNVMVMPNYVEAQEARKSDRQRQRDSRVKARDSAMSRKVTETPETVTPIELLSHQSSGCHVSSATVPEENRDEENRGEVSLSAHVLGASDPNPERARVERSPGCKCQGDICLTPSLCEQATVAAIANAALEKLTKRPTGHDLVTWFGAIRLEVFPNTLPWNTARDSKGDAGSFAALLSEDDIADLKPTMRLALEHIRDGVKGWHDPRLAKDPSFSFGAWKSGFHALREEMHRKAPPAPGSLEARKPARPVVKPYERMGDYAKEAASDGASASVADPDSLIRDLVHHLAPPSDRERSTS